MKTVYVGLSGGVDSAVSAYLLKRAGFNVVGAFIKGWEPAWLPCTGTEDRLSAMRVAAQLEIPFVTYDLSEAYKASVVDYFVSEYQAGRTPNPDVVCNRTIKFGAFWERAQSDGADCIATGHYATTDHERLYTSKDPDKDQAYFLWTLTEADLQHVLFPVGALRKTEVRALAKKALLPNSARKDSQGLCFLGHVDMHDFLERYIPPENGRIVDTNGTEVGQHDGAWYYTLGQHIPTTTGERMYVVKKDTAKNELMAGTSVLAEAGKTVYMLVHTSWVGGAPPVGRVQAQYRYHGPFVGGVITHNGVQFDEPVAVAAGQSVVFYDQKKKECFGGGVVA